MRRFQSRGSLNTNLRSTFYLSSTVSPALSASFVSDLSEKTQSDKKSFRLAGSLKTYKAWKLLYLFYYVVLYRSTLIEITMQMKKKEKHCWACCCCDGGATLALAFVTTNGSNRPNIPGRTQNEVFTASDIKCYLKHDETMYADAIKKLHKSCSRRKC